MHTTQTHTHITTKNTQTKTQINKTQHINNTKHTHTIQNTHNQNKKGQCKYLYMIRDT